MPPLDADYPGHMIRTTDIPGAPRDGHKRGDESMPFVSTCPKCGRPEPQLAFSCRALQRSLDEGLPVEAYCAMCDVFWQISPRERVEIATRLVS